MIKIFSRIAHPPTAEYNMSPMFVELSKFLVLTFISEKLLQTLFQNAYLVIRQNNSSFTSPRWEIKDENSATAFVYNFFKLAGPKITTCCGSLRFMGL